MAVVCPLWFQRCFHPGFSEGEDYGNGGGDGDGEKRPPARRDGVSYVQGGLVRPLRPGREGGTN